MQMKFKRIAAMLLALALLVTTGGLLNAVTVFALGNGETLTLVAASDLQDSENEIANTQAILNQMKKDTQDADGFLACGDYDIGYLDAAGTADKIGALSQTLVDSGVVSADAQMVYVQGNHDQEAGIGSALANTGDNDPASGEYGVFVLNYRDTSSLAAAKTSAEQLRTYLNEKLAAGYKKPVIVLAHAPLHYSMRTYTHGEFPGAEYVFNVLNDAGEKGLNIFFLFGHNHSTWDHYLGGGAVYLPKGDSIMIATRDNTQEYQTHKLAFTYMNAGYIGYYSDGAVSGTDCTLTMTKLEISESAVTVTRYSAEGTHNLKSAGVNNHYREEYYNPNRSVYTSPQTVALTAVEDTTPLDEVKIRSVSMSLTGVLGVNIKVDMGTADASAYTVAAAIDGGAEQILTSDHTQNGLAVYTADLLIQDLHKDVNITLKKGEQVLQEQTFSFADYKEKLQQLYPKDKKLAALLTTLENYGSYAAHYADNTLALTPVEAVEAVTGADLEDYKHSITRTGAGETMEMRVALHLNTACDLLVKLETAVFADSTLTVNGEAVAPESLFADGSYTVWQDVAMLPQDWGKTQTIAVSSNGTQLMVMQCSALSYARVLLNRAQELQPGINGLMKAMYLYSKAAEDYLTEEEVTYIQVAENILSKTPTGTTAEGLPADANIANIYNCGWTVTSIAEGIDVMKYAQLKFYVKTDNTDKYLELYDSVGNYVLSEHSADWTEVTLTKDNGQWTMFVNGMWRSDGFTGTTLAELFPKVQLGGSATASVYITDLLGVEDADYEDPFGFVADNLLGSGEAADNVPEGYEQSTKLNIAWTADGVSFADVDLTPYQEVKFAIQSVAYHGLGLGGETLAANSGTGWMEVRLVKNGANWDFCYDGELKDTVTLPGNSLSALSLLTGGENTYYITELRGMADPNYAPPAEPVYITVSENPFALTGEASSEAIDGYDTVTALTTSWNAYDFNSLDLTPYLQVKFAVKSEGYYGVMVGGSVINESKGTIEIQLIKNGAAWDLYYNGEFQQALTLANNDLSDLRFRFGANTYYVTELKAIADPSYVIPVYTTVSGQPFALTGEASSETITGYDTVTALTTSWNAYDFNSFDLTPYLQVKFAVKSEGYYGVMVGGSVINESKGTIEIELIKNGTAWDLYYNGAFQQALTLANNNLTDIRFRFGSNTYYVTELKGMADPAYVYISEYTQVVSNLLNNTPTSTTTENLPSRDVSIVNITHGGWASPGVVDGITMAGYTELKFWYKVSDENKWFEMYDAGGSAIYQGHATEWTEVKLLCEGDTWTLYVNGTAVKYGLSGATLKDIVATLTLGGSVEADVYVTDLIGKTVQ